VKNAFPVLPMLSKVQEIKKYEIWGIYGSLTFLRKLLNIKKAAQNTRYGVLIIQILSLGVAKLCYQRLSSTNRMCNDTETDRH